jgi:hypothetical protein
VVIGFPLAHLRSECGLLVSETPPFDKHVQNTSAMRATICRTL